MENKSITVTIDGKKYSVTKGSTLEQIKNDFYSDSKSIVVAAYVNNEIRELTYAVTEDCNITFIDLSTADGARIYERSLTFLLVKAFHDIFPGESLEICHSVSKGLFFECSVRGLDENGVKIIEARMRELVNMDLPFEKRPCPPKRQSNFLLTRTGLISTER
ncbi:hypothetical protein [Thermoclostridium stercorarium]